MVNELNRAVTLNHRTSYGVKRPASACGESSTCSRSPSLKRSLSSPSLIALTTTPVLLHRHVSTSCSPGYSSRIDDRRCEPAMTAVWKELISWCSYLLDYQPRSHGKVYWSVGSFKRVGDCPNLHRLTEQCIPYNDEERRKSPILSLQPTGYKKILTFIKRKHSSRLFSSKNDVDSKYVRGSKCSNVFYSTIAFVLSKATLLFVFILFIITVMDECFHSYALHPMNPDSIKPSYQNYQDSSLNEDTHQQSSYYSVVINTYKRPDLLKSALNHYANKCGLAHGVAVVHVIWADEETAPPSVQSLMTDDESETMFLKRSKKDTRSRIEIRRVPNSLNSRFLPIKNDDLIMNEHNISIPISDAMFMVDDDMRVDCFSLQKAFHAWKLSPNSMVGFYPRLASPARSFQQNKNERDLQLLYSSSHKSSVDPVEYMKNLVYHAWPIVYHTQQFNFVLTKACFIHSRYMSFYSSTTNGSVSQSDSLRSKEKTGNEFSLLHPKEILDYVDKYFNCEDIAMAMLVANITRYEYELTKKHPRDQTLGSNEPVHPAQPIFVEGNVVDLGILKGISTKGGHMKQRSECLVDISRIYIQNGWKLPFDGSFGLQDAAYLHHYPGYRWQSRPSYWAEWFALSDILR